LQLQRNLADFVQKNGATVCELESSDPVAMRAREGTFDVTEEFTFEEFLRNRGAIDFDQRPFGPVTARMDCPRDEFLADAGFAENENIRGRIRHGFHLCQHVLQRGTPANNPPDCVPLHLWRPPACE